MSIQTRYILKWSNKLLPYGQNRFTHRGTRLMYQRANTLLYSSTIPPRRSSGIKKIWRVSPIAPRFVLLANGSKGRISLFSSLLIFIPENVPSWLLNWRILRPSHASIYARVAPCIAILCCPLVSPRRPRIDHNMKRGILAGICFNPLVDGSKSCNALFRSSWHFPRESPDLINPICHALSC